MTRRVDGALARERTPSARPRRAEAREDGATFGDALEGARGRRGPVARRAEEPRRRREPGGGPSPTMPPADAAAARPRDARPSDRPDDAGGARAAATTTAVALAVLDGGADGAATPAAAATEPGAAPASTGDDAAADEDGGAGSPASKAETDAAGSAEASAPTSSSAATEDDPTPGRPAPGVVHLIEVGAPAAPAHVAPPAELRAADAPAPHARAAPTAPPPVPAAPAPAPATLAMTAVDEVTRARLSPSRAELVIGEGEARVALRVTASHQHVRIEATAADPSLASAIGAGVDALRSALARHGLELGDLTAGHGDHPGAPPDRRSARDGQPGHEPAPEPTTRRPGVRVIV